MIPRWILKNPLDKRDSGGYTCIMNTHWTTYVCETGSKYELECSIEYRFTPGDPGVRFYPDGSGSPPTPSEVELISVEVDVIYPFWASHTLNKLWLKDRGWDEWANEIAWQILDELLNDDTDFYRTLVDDAGYE